MHYQPPTIHPSTHPSSTLSTLPPSLHPPIIHNTHLSIIYPLHPPSLHPPSPHSLPYFSLPHLRLHVLPGVIVKELSIAVDTSDDSYMPKELAVLVGNSESGLRELRTVTVPRWVLCTWNCLHGSKEYQGTLLHTKSKEV